MMHIAYQIGHGLAIMLPLRVSYAIATAIASVYFSLSLGDRKALEENLRVVFGNKISDERLKKYTYRAFVNFAKYLVDFFRMSRFDARYMRRYVKVEGKEYVDQALKEGRGVVVLSSHIGNWEMGAAVLSALGYDTYGIALVHADGKVNRIFNDQRRKGGYGAIATGSTLRKALKVLKENKLLGILGDRDFSTKGVSMPFFGVPAMLPKGPAFFSLKAGAPIVPAFLIRTKADTFRFIIGKPMGGVAGKPAGDRLKALMAECIEVIEKHIRMNPDQWYVFRRVWDRT
ncbi:MAG: lysophospholipid acyltransferase family protein [Candidatus Omnitrophota bacterium]